MCSEERVLAELNYKDTWELQQEKNAQQSPGPSREVLVNTLSSPCLCAGREGSWQGWGRGTFWVEVQPFPGPGTQHGVPHARGSKWTPVAASGGPQPPVGLVAGVASKRPPPGAAPVSPGRAILPTPVSSVWVGPTTHPRPTPGGAHQCLDRLCSHPWGALPRRVRAGRDACFCRGCLTTCTQPDAHRVSKQPRCLPSHLLPCHVTPPLSTSPQSQVPHLSWACLDPEGTAEVTLAQTQLQPRSRGFRLCLLAL